MQTAARTLRRGQEARTGNQPRGSTVRIGPGLTHPQPLRTQRGENLIAR